MMMKVSIPRMLLRNIHEDVPHFSPMGDQPHVWASIDDYDTWSADKRGHRDFHVHQGLESPPPRRFHNGYVNVNLQKNKKDEG